MKTCSKCGEDKPLVEFSPRSAPRSGPRSSCKACTSKRSRDWYAANPHAHRLRQYGLSAVAFEAMKLEQGNACAICHRPFGDREPWVDHCHATGRVRGLLCPSCNDGIGKLGDDPARLEAAAEYVRAAGRNRDESVPD